MLLFLRVLNGRYFQIFITLGRIRFNKVENYFVLTGDCLSCISYL